MSSEDDADKPGLESPKESPSFEEMTQSPSHEDTVEPARPRIYSEEDAEIRVAKAMALAIQNNPNMTPEEIRLLTENLQKKSHLDTQLREVQDDISSSPKSDLEGDKQKRRMTLGKNLRDKAKEAKEKLEKFKKDMVASNNITKATSFDEGSLRESPKSKEKSSVKLSLSPMRSFAARSISNPPALQTPPLSEPQLLEEKPTVDSEKSPVNRSKSPPPPDSPSQIADAKIRLSAILWKRRSGFGKLSSKNAWERRRVILAGTKVSYFKSPDDGAEDAKDTSEDAPEEDAPTSEATTEIPDAGRRATWLEHAALNIEKARDNLTQIGIIQNADLNPPRGSLDLVKEHATVSATGGHSGAPSPFCISIKVRGETKWKFSFDSHSLQMEWLAALTDVVVTASVDAYNASLVAAADPTQENIPLFVSAPAPLEPKHDASEGHRLWMMEKYMVESSNNLGDMVDNDDDLDEDDLEGDDADSTFETLDMPLSASDSPPVAKASWLANPMALGGNNLYIMTVLMNSALFYSRASSTGINRFWSVVTFVNLALWLLVEKEDEDKTLGGKRNISGDVSVGKETVKEETTKKLGKSARSKSVAKTKPVAGTTTVPIKNPTDVPSNKDGQIFAGWRAPPGSNLAVRSHGYLSTKKKVPSPGEMYTLAHVDIFESRNQFRDMAKRVKLPKVEFNDDGVSKTWHAPDIFVISVALPTDPPRMGRSADDGGGYTITMYYTMKETTRDILKRVTAPDYNAASEEKVDDVQKSQVNAVKLFDAWCHRAPTDPKYQARFKLVANAQNLKEIGMPNWIAKYNGKPVLIKRSGQTGFLYSHPELNAMEFDISFHPFPYLAKQAICYMKDSFFKKILVTFGFLIEGRADDELPECLIGLMQLCYPDPKYAIQAPDFFSGSSPKSF